MSDPIHEPINELPGGMVPALRTPEKIDSFPIPTNTTPHELAEEGAEGVIDWDVQIDDPPPRPSQTVKVQFVEGGQRPLTIPDDPLD
jgi:hypothetical protein